MKIAQFTGCLAASVAIAAGLLAKVDSALVLERATLALMLGWVCGQVWYMLLKGVVPTVRTEHDSYGLSHAEAKPGSTGD